MIYILCTRENAKNVFEGSYPFEWIGGAQNNIGKNHKALRKIEIIDKILGC